jgi:membrane-associated protease RseP (regulator of RpoE activity)
MSLSLRPLSNDRAAVIVAVWLSAILLCIVTVGVVYFMSGLLALPALIILLGGGGVGTLIAFKNLRFDQNIDRGATARTRALWSDRLKIILAVWLFAFVLCIVAVAFVYYMTGGYLFAAWPAIILFIGGGAVGTLIAFKDKDLSLG